MTLVPMVVASGAEIYYNMVKKCKQGSSFLHLPWNKPVSAETTRFKRIPSSPIYQGVFWGPPDKVVGSEMVDDTRTSTRQGSIAEEQNSDGSLAQER
jgi:hypothetical protein